MNHVVHLLAPHLPLVLGATTLLMAIGCACLSVARTPAHRQRIGELTLAGVLGWLALAAIPLPRLLPDGLAWLGLQAATTDDNTAKRATTLSPPITWAGGTLPGEATGAQNSSAAPLNRRVESDLVAALGLGAMPTRAPAPAGRRGHESQRGMATQGSADGTRQSSIDAVLGSKGAKGYVGGAGVPNILSPDASRSVAVESNATNGNDLAPLRPAPERTVSRNRAPTRPWLEIATWIYLLAAAAAVFWLLLGYALLARERWMAESPPAWLYRLFQSAALWSKGRLPRLVISRRCSRPLSWGMLRPMIALPERICHRTNRDQLRTILLHELGHVRRGDARGNLLFEIAFPLFYFHPLYWWLRREVRMAAELVADDWAARQTGKETYVAQLVALARGTSPARLSLLIGTSAFSNPSQFYRRMQMLLAREKPLTTRPSFIWRLGSLAGLTIAVALSAALAGVNPAIGQQPDKRDQSATKPERSIDPLSAAKDEPPSAARDVAAREAPAIEAAAPKAEPAGTDHPTAPAPAKPTVEQKPDKPFQTTSELPRPTKMDSAYDAKRLVNERDALAQQIRALQSQLKELEKASGDGTFDRRQAKEALQRDGQNKAAENNNLPEAEIEAVISKDPQIQQAVAELAALTRELHEVERSVVHKTDPAAVRIRDQIAGVRQSIDEIKNADRQQATAAFQRDQARRAASFADGDSKSKLPETPSPAGGKTVRLTRVDENGRVYEESWSTDPDGKPTRIINKSEVSGEKTIAVARPGVVAHNGVIKEFVDGNGTTWLHLYELQPDGSAGRLIEAHQMAKSDRDAEPTEPAAVPPSAAASGEAPMPYPGHPAKRAWVSPPASSEVPSPALTEGGAANHAPPATSNRFARSGTPGYQSMPTSAAIGESAGPVVSTRPIDLVALATSYADAVGAEEVAKAKVDESGGSPSTRAGLNSAIRKEQLLRHIAEVAAKGAKQDYERGVKLHGAGAISIEEFAEMQSRVEILQQILNTGSDSGGLDKPSGAGAKP
ncbi:MAG TPA: M56 family metallopeptidase [Pirellulales bacterium]|jgi:beta-lactamase regulating signal transducer with metallopeptidase domain|nr:M56 family metallopeptidase [Pirellulales bacterium]